MKIFVAGGSGAIGTFLIPLLVDDRHEVVALVRDRKKAGHVEALGARAVVANPLDKEALTATIRQVGPEVVINQLTALKGAENFKKFDEQAALTNRFRTEVTDTMLAAAHDVGTKRFIAQSFCGWPYAREGGPVKSEEDPFDPMPPKSFKRTLAALRHLESSIRKAVDVSAVALRYGFFYGPGTSIALDGPIAGYIRSRKLPLVGDGGGIWSFIHIKDAARATVLAVSNGAPGAYNIVDDDPAPVSTWLPYLAEVLGARPPRRIPAWLAKFAIGEGGVSMMTTIRGASNAKAKREFRWELTFPTWRRGFVEGIGSEL